MILRHTPSCYHKQKAGSGLVLLAFLSASSDLFYCKMLLGHVRGTAFIS